MVFIGFPCSGTFVFCLCTLCSISCPAFENLLGEWNGCYVKRRHFSSGESSFLFSSLFFFFRVPNITSRCLIVSGFITSPRLCTFISYASTVGWDSMPSPSLQRFRLRKRSEAKRGLLEPSFGSAFFSFRKNSGWGVWKRCRCMFMRACFSIEDIVDLVWL